MTAIGLLIFLIVFIIVRLDRTDSINSFFIGALSLLGAGFFVSGILVWVWRVMP